VQTACKKKGICKTKKLKNRMKFQCAERCTKTAKYQEYTHHHNNKRNQRETAPQLGGYIYRKFLPL
jgi:hypothetical protein